MRAAEDLDLLERLVDEGIAFEICPTSNVQLGVFQDHHEVPLRTLVDAGAKVALGADDPLLFRSRLVDQYSAARDVHGFSTAEIAELAKSSIDASLATDSKKRKWKEGVEAWLTTNAEVA